ncbi:hypothetical protein M0805_007535 [Coniferiporia weirii]|nr:hypothetical protein M0805_007535 [Coniferiporia weirii]
MDLVFDVLKDLVFYLCSLLFGRFVIDSELLQNRLRLLQESLPPSAEDSRTPADTKCSGPETDSSTASMKKKEPSQWIDTVRALCKAIIRQDVKVVLQALEASPSLAQKRHRGGWSILHVAALSGNVDILKAVLAQPEVNVFATDDLYLNAADEDVREMELGIRTTGTKGATPLHYACMIGNIDIIKMLVERGASFNTKDEEGRTPVEYFDVHHSEALVAYQELFEAWTKRRDSYFETSRADGLVDMIRENRLVSFEISVRKKPALAAELTYYDFTLLHMTVIRELRPQVEIILSVAPSAINVFDKRGNHTSDQSFDYFAPPKHPHKFVKDVTALHYACLTGNLEIIELLLKAGADWEIEDGRARKPEDLIYMSGKNGDYVKREFLRLRDEEAERRKRAKDGNTEGDEKTGENKGGEEGGDGEKFSIGSEDSSRSLEVVLGDKLVGQRGPINVVANAIRLRQYGWVDPDRPLVMLFLGSSGVGKTELAKQIALYIHGKDGLSTDKGSTLTNLENDRGFVRIDMSEYQEKHSVSNLYGSPKSYVGYDDGGSLTQALKTNPKAIVLLDEIEKAHPDVLAVFLQVFDDGRLTDTKDGVVYCKDAVFIMTSNLASDEIKAQAPLLRELIADTEAQSRPEEYLRVVGQFNRSIHPILKGALKRDEFLGRINQIVVFLPLNQEEIELVVKGELNMWRKRSNEKHEISVSWAHEVVKKLALAYDVNYGARSVVNEVQRIAIQLIADAHIKGRIQNNWHVYLTIDGVGDIIMKATDFRNDARDRRGCRFIM